MPGVYDQFFDFSDLQIFFGDMVVKNLMHVLIDRRGAKTKAIGFTNLRFGVGELQVDN